MSHLIGLLGLVFFLLSSTDKNLSRFSLLDGFFFQKNNVFDQNETSTRCYSYLSKKSYWTAFFIIDIFCYFLDVSSHLYKSVFPSVRRSATARSDCESTQLIHVLWEAYLTVVRNWSSISSHVPCTFTFEVHSTQWLSQEASMSVQACFSWFACFASIAFLYNRFFFSVFFCLSIVSFAWSENRWNENWIFQ